MPDTFEQWLEATSKRIRELEAAGVIMEKVVIDHKQFAAWCLASGMDYDFATLGAFTIVAERKQRERGT
jgi:hypothetical protein